MIIRTDQPLANDHLDWSAFCKCSSGWNDLLQMIIRMVRPLSNGHTDQPASCKWSSGSTGLLQMIIRIDRHREYPTELEICHGGNKPRGPNDHPDGPAFCKWSSRWTGLMQMFLQFLLCYSSPAQKTYFPSTNIFLLFLFYESSSLQQYISCLQIYS